jgi:hypothetical protein
MKRKLPQQKEMDDEFDQVGVEAMTYEAHWRQYRVRIDGPVDDKQKGLLLRAMAQTSDGFGKA